MDLTESIQPRSDQVNADDFLGGPQVVTITEVKQGASPEQPVDIVLAEYGPGRPFKPSKTARRVLVAAWGAEGSAYTGRRMTLYCDPDVKFGGSTVGGIRISHLSHINMPVIVSLTVTRGKRKPFTVNPLPDATPSPTAARDWKADAERLSGNVDALRALYMDAQAAGADQDTLSHIQNQAGATA